MRGHCRNSELRKRFSAQPRGPLIPAFSPHAGRRRGCIARHNLPRTLSCPLLSWPSALASRRCFAPESSSCAKRKLIARQQNTVMSNAKPVLDKRKPGVGPVFRSSVIPVSSDQSKKMKEAERRQTLGSTAASCDAARALLERARLTAFHHGSRPRELFHPKGSASGQASWDVV